MANVNAPFGLAAVSNILTSSYGGDARKYYIPSTDSNAYAVGDPVKTLTGGADANGVSGVVLATAGASQPIRGVIVGIGGVQEGGVTADPANLNTTIIPATKTKAYYVLVMDDPWAMFEIQEFSGAGSTNFTAADIGKGCNLKSGTNNGYISGWTLDDTAASSVASTQQVRLMGIRRTFDNAFGSYCKFLVMLNQHELKAATAGL